MVRPMWGKKLFHLTHELDRLVAESRDKFGQNVEIHATIYWSGNELVGPDGIEDEPRWPFRPSKLDQASVYEGMKERLKQLNVVSQKCSTFALVAGPEADIYGFTQVWDMFFERFRTWCKDLKLKYVDATYVAEHIDKADHYHMVERPLRMYQRSLHFSLRSCKHSRLANVLRSSHPHLMQFLQGSSSLAMMISLR